jgi:hypothetical protein
MNKQELITELQGTFYKVGESKNAETNPVGLAIRQKEGIAWHEIGVYEADGDVMVRKNIQIYIANEGTQLEQAFYKDKRPENALIKAREAAELAKLTPVVEPVIEPPASTPKSPVMPGASAPTVKAKTKRTGLAFSLSSFFGRLREAFSVLAFGIHRG